MRGTFVEMGMSEELVCPDCGGFIGLEPGDLRQACRCFTPATTAPATSPAPASAALRPEIARMLRQAEASSLNKLPPVERTRLETPVEPTADAAGDTRGLDASSDDSDSGSASVAGGVTPDAGTGSKLCRVCGKDLAGHRRLKDSLGYLCRECAKTTETPDDEGRRPCPECNRKIKPAGFVPYNGKHICRRCFADHMELDKYKKAAPSAAIFVKEEKKSLTRLLIFAGVLLLLMAYSAYLHLGHH